MKICILSDSHDNRRLLGCAVEDARARGAEQVLHCGDVVAPTTLRAILKLGLPLHVIHGNNTGDIHNMHTLVGEAGGLLHYHGQDAALELAGRRIFLVHYPHYARAMATTGDWDLVCCGHDHKAEITALDNLRGGKTLYLNPGTVGGVGAPPTYVMGDLATLKFTIETVPADPAILCNMPSVTPHH